MNNSNATIQDLANNIDDLAVSVRSGFEQVDSRIDDLTIYVKSGFEQVDKRFEDVYSRLDSIDAKLIFIQKEVADIKERLIKLEERTIEDGNVFGSDILNLRNRVALLEKKIEQLSHH